ncbi:unnamed protein product [Ambrosiozyma monospora]|uniref:Unnamed protein product n=1 Tax=Ambrosiozyma monospora TaxID=43982 RepID=A0ACB5T2P9_AMBMO|nr:unnamed protein product [Ambrosiozyma monospora]
MAILVAAVFLPYTVHFEVESDYVANHDPNIDEIAKPILQTATTGSKLNLTAPSSSNLRALGSSTTGRQSTSTLVASTPSNGQHDAIIEEDESQDTLSGTESDDSEGPETSYSIIAMQNANRSCLSLGDDLTSPASELFPPNLNSNTNGQQNITCRSVSPSATPLRWKLRQKVDFQFDDDGDSISTLDSLNNMGPNVEVPDSTAPPSLPMNESESQKSVTNTTSTTNVSANTNAHLSTNSYNFSTTTSNLNYYNNNVTGGVYNSGNSKMSSTSITSNHVSVQDFFFNNPNKSKMSLSSAALTRMLSNDSNSFEGLNDDATSSRRISGITSPFSHSSSNNVAGSIGMSLNSSTNFQHMHAVALGEGKNGPAFIQPKSSISVKKNMSVSDLNKLNNFKKLEAASPSLRVSRSGIFNKKRQPAYSSTPLISSSLRNSSSMANFSSLSISDGAVANGSVESFTYGVSDDNFDKKEYMFDALIEEDEDFNKLFLQQRVMVH